MLVVVVWGNLPGTLALGVVGNGGGIQVAEAASLTLEVEVEVEVEEAKGILGYSPTSCNLDK